MLTPQEIIIVILIFGFIYLFYKTSELNKPDHFTASDDVKEAINEIYKADINAIRNLSNFATEIYNEKDSFTIPAKTTTITDLTVNGNVKFTNKNSNMIEIFPQYMVIAWASSNIPKGWATCDGKIYKLNNDGTSSEDSSGIQTPDLRGRFVLGSGVGGKDNTNKPLSERKLDQTGGEEMHLLTIAEMPSHGHQSGGAICSDMNGCGYKNIITKERNDINTNNTGGDAPHNNMPPFYVLTYIMKL
jgi:microcystin-dependent protein